MASGRRGVSETCSVCAEPVGADQRICGSCGATRVGRGWRVPQPLDPKEKSSVDPTRALVVIGLTVLLLAGTLTVIYLLVQSF